MISCKVTICLLFLLGALFQIGCAKKRTVEVSASLPEVYNAVFSSTIGGTSNVLLDEKPVDVSFFIGLHDPRSAVPPAERSVDPRIFEGPNVRDLYVTATCLFCLNAKTQKQAIKYAAPNGTSTKATFTLVPSRKLIRNDKGATKVVFQVSGIDDGILYDNVVVPVTVGDDGLYGENSLAPSAPNSRPIVLRPVGFTKHEGSSNIDLTISCFEESGKIVLQLTSADPELNKRFAGRNLKPDGKTPVSFKTSLSAKRLSMVVGGDYAELLSVMEKKPGLLRLLTGNPNTSQGPSSQYYDMSDDNEAALLKVFFKNGKSLYSKLFLEGDKRLAVLAKALDDYEPGDSFPPLRVRIESQIPFVPWQYLHSFQTKLDAQKFWGFRYELIVDPSGSQPDFPYATDTGPLKGPVILIKYQADKEKDSEADSYIASLGEDEYKLLSGLVTSAVIKTDSLESFKAALEKHVDETELIVAFTHGENGSPLILTPDGEYIINLLPTGPRLRFKKDEALTARAFDDYPSVLNRSPLSFGKQPLVILNGCETSGVGYFATPDFNFPAIFIRFGARGVIATEAPIWPGFGFGFGKTLLTKLKSEGRVSEALLDSRREWLKENKNPLGLLYSYYGGADAVLKFE